ncbi:MAG: DegV family protein [Firmicutes bacterium]|nr:DegV family protein [Bacillota bacterium]
MPVKIVADSTCDLSKELIERYDVTIIPLHVVLGDKEYSDGVDISPEQIYAWSDANGKTPKTSAPSIDEAKNVIRAFTEKDPSQEVVLFTISASMSATNNILRMAAENLHVEDRVFVIDSKNLSTGIGLSVIQASIWAKEGKSGKEIAQGLDEMLPKVRASFVVDTLVYLHRGGRCSGLAAMFGSAFKIHPEIVVEDGAMHPSRKYRGKMDVVTVKYAKDLENALLNAVPDRVFITHSDADEKTVSLVRDYLKGLNYFDEILETNAGGVIASHCGPGTLGVLFVSK